ncbi:sigma-70 family RNA polymerase sigma factor [Patescibacteria group bacterium]|nr:sigma-70 family RNA polymerase sigma factor [Patescibacteria group bacterium]MCL5409384.1 sigma-70 family RNA polymerase sigma factor [Patescibacteria group bacterium]
MDKTPHNSLTYQSFSLLYQKFALPLMKFLIKRMSGNKQAAAEVFASTMSAAWQSYHTFQNKSQFFTWLCRIAINKMADYYREQINDQSKWIAPGLEFLAQLKSKDPTPEEKLALKELRQSVINCLNLLPAEKRQLLYFRYWQELSIEAIAQILGISERAAEGKIYRAKLSLKEVIVENYPDLTH